MKLGKVRWKGAKDVDKAGVLDGKNLVLASPTASGVYQAPSRFAILRMRGRLRSDSSITRTMRAYRESDGTLVASVAQEGLLRERREEP